MININNPYNNQQMSDQNEQLIKNYTQLSVSCCDKIIIQSIFGFEHNASFFLIGINDDINELLNDKKLPKEENNIDK